jgi:hypothetical protein
MGGNVARRGERRNARIGCWRESQRERDHENTRKTKT